MVDLKWQSTLLVSLVSGRCYLKTDSKYRGIFVENDLDELVVDI